MASLKQEVQNGRKVWRITFYDRDKNRKRIRLGDIGKKAATAYLTKIDQLNDCVSARQPLTLELVNWLEEVGDIIYGKLVKAELVPPRQKANLAAFLDAYIAERTDAKPNTIRNFKSCRDKLVGYLGEDTELRSITPGDGDQWRQHLLNQEYAKAVVSKSVKLARQFFKVAVRRRLIQSNPFADVKGGTERNDDRLKFISKAAIEQVLAVTTDVEWRLIIALARYGGLRTPSETLALKWSHIDWERERITVPSPKTACQGKASRQVPLWPELRPHLEAAFDAAPEGAEYVILRYRLKESNLRTQFHRLIEKAKVPKWERAFQNLRASRQTELADEYPAKVVSDWIGNSPAVANAHYIQTTEEHFKRAVKPRGAKDGADMGQKMGLHGNAHTIPDAAKPPCFPSITPCFSDENAELCGVGDIDQYSLRLFNADVVVAKSPRFSMKTAFFLSQSYSKMPVTATFFGTSLGQTVA